MKNELKHILALAILLLAPCSLLRIQAQVTGTNSSYSRFGLGLLNDQSQGFNKSMGGVGIGVRIGNRINTTNPASYSAIDSLSLILDVGMTASFGKMTQGTQQVGVKNAALDYVHAGMHIAKRLGLAVGFMPYTSVGYDFSTPEKTIVSNPQNTLVNTHADSYTGSGGLNQAYIGLGWRVYRGLSVGANVSFLWGSNTHTVLPQYSEGGVSSTSHISNVKIYSASLRTFKIDLGAQYPVRLTPQDWLNIGATYGLGHKIPQDATILTGTRLDTIPSPFDLPHTLGLGVAWQHKNTLLVAADVRHEWWGSCRMPVETAGGYAPMKGSFKDMTKFAVGTQWTPDPYDKKYWKRIQYRAGINYTTPYLKVDGENGPSELRMSIGAGLPITNRINNRSVVNVGVQWLRRSASGDGMVKENYLLFSLGLTFNELWFMKYKIE